MVDELAGITRTDIKVLKDSNTPQFTSVAARLARAAERQTQKKEDEAYCLMGLFDINMPMISLEVPQVYLCYPSKGA